MSKSSLIVLASLLYSGSAAAAPLADDETSSGGKGGQATMGAGSIDDLDALGARCIREVGFPLAYVR